MPLYEYQCNACEEVSEVLHKIADPKPAVCPKCEAKDSLTKQMSAAAFHLKGGGWFTDAYASKKPAEPTKDSKDSGSSGASSADKESTPAKSNSSPSPKADKPSSTKSSD